MDKRAWAANNLAARLLAGPWTRAAIDEAVKVAKSAPKRVMLRALVLELAALGAEWYPPSPQQLQSALLNSLFFEPRPDRPVAIVLDPPRFAPRPPFETLDIPRLAAVGDLAAWLGETPEQLDWLSDERRCNGRAGALTLQHYNYAFVRARSGKLRLIEAPKPRLKAIQRRILREILAAVPVSPHAHGFVPGRSCLSGAQIHAGEAVVATFDLTQFFPSLGLPRIHGIFRSLGYPWAVARRLSGLCTTICPSSVFQRIPTTERPGPDIRAIYGVPHLPQGAPTSPALANLAAWTLDRRLHGLARAAGANYTRYADDLAFSGDRTFAEAADRFTKSVCAIAREEGFRLNAAKTKKMPQNGRQRITGIIVNRHCNVARTDFDHLKAILHNCTRTGPALQNRANIENFRNHLAGRVAWVEQISPARGAKLRAIFERIDWSVD